MARYCDTLVEVNQAILAWKKDETFRRCRVYPVKPNILSVLLHIHTYVLYSTNIPRLTGGSFIIYSNLCVDHWRPTVNNYILLIQLLYWRHLQSRRVWQMISQFVRIASEGLWAVCGLVYCGTWDCLLYRLMLGFFRIVSSLLNIFMCLRCGYIYPRG